MKPITKMNGRVALLTLLIASALVLPLRIVASKYGAGGGPVHTEPGENGMSADLTERFSQLPISFEENRGQAASSIKYQSRVPGYRFRFASSEAFVEMETDAREADTIASHGIAAGSREKRASLRLGFPGSNPSVCPKGEGQLAGTSNYFIGTDPRQWLENVPTYARVKYDTLYTGVDVAFYGNQQRLEYDFTVAPGARYEIIRIGFEGADRIRLDDGGDLEIEALNRKFLQARPMAYQEVNGTRETIAARYVVEGNSQIGFEIGAYDSNRALIIDPVFSYSTYLGNAAINSVAVDRAGNAYVTGTYSLDNFGPSFDAFVMKLNPEGTALVYSTFLGGSDRMIPKGIQNGAFDIAVDSNGNAYVTGSTTSKDFPTTPGAFQTALQGTIAGRKSAFVTKLNATGDALAYSTYLGGSDNFSSSGQAIVVDEAGNAYVTGSTESMNFPLVNPLQSINRGGTCFGGDVVFLCHTEAFVTKLNALGTGLIYSTYLGGERDDSGSDIAIDGAGSAYVVGTTSASGFPTKNPLQPLNAGSTDLFIAKLSADGNQLVYSTLLGGSGNDTANGVAVDLSGNAYVIGRTSSTDFPTNPGSLQEANASSTAFKSTDGGTTWSAINRGLPGSDAWVGKLLLDPMDASTLYAITSGGLFKSTNGGHSWRSLALRFFTDLVIDPTNSSTLYAAFSGIFLFGGVDKSTDGGRTWFEADSGLAPNAPFSILIDPKSPTTLYAAAVLIDGRGRSAGIFKSTDGGIRWFPSARGISPLNVFTFALAPAKPRKLYTFSGGMIFRSTNHAKKWKPGGLASSVSAASLAVDPLDPNTIYLGTPSGVFKSTDGAETWAIKPLHANIALLVVDPKNPSTIYAAGRDFANVDSNFKSTDGGESWKAIGRIVGHPVLTFAIDPNDTARIYAGVASGSADAFIAKISPTGAALLYSTYIGGSGDDTARAIAVDAQGNAYLTGQTSSEDFLIKNAVQLRKQGSPASYDAFLTKLDSSGAPIFSSYLGGSGNDDARALALDGAGGVYIVGGTDSDDFPTLNPLQRTRNGSFGNGFITKVVDAPAAAAEFLSRKTLVRLDSQHRFAYR